MCTENHAVGSYDINISILVLRYWWSNSGNVAILWKHCPLLHPITYCRN